MIFFRIFSVSALAIALSMVAFANAADTGATGKPGPDKAKPSEGNKKPDGKPDAQPPKEKEVQGLGSFGRMLPLGQKNLDVKIPSFKAGKPESFVSAGSMTRIDDNHMDIDQMDILMYGATRETDLHIQIPSGVYDMNTQVMTGDKRSRVSRADFQIEGDALVFDTRSQQGKMTGHIHMIIYSAETLTKKPEASPTPSDGKQPGINETSEKK